MLPQTHWRIYMQLANDNSWFLLSRGTFSQSVILRLQHYHRRMSHDNWPILKKIYYKIERSSHGKNKMNHTIAAMPSYDTFRRVYRGIIAVGFQLYSLPQT